MFSVVDDVVIAGCGQTVEEAQIVNQRKLTETLKRCAEKNIVLNEDKEQTGLTEITFHGHNHKGWCENLRGQSTSYPQHARTYRCSGCETSLWHGTVHVEVHA